MRSAQLSGFHLFFMHACQVPTFHACVLDLWLCNRHPRVPITAAATEDVPEVAGEALKAIVTGLQSVAKGRQEIRTANDIQVHSDL